MYKLQVEELEPRQLLSGASVSSQPAVASAAAASSCAAPKTEQAPVVVSGSAHGSSVGPDAARQSSGQLTSTPANSHPSLGSNRQTPASPAPSAGNAAATDTTASSQSLSAVHDVLLTVTDVGASADSASTNNGTPPAGAAQPANSSGEPIPAAPQTLAAPPVERPNPPPPPGQENFAAPPLLHLDTQAVTRAIVAAFRESNVLGALSAPEFGGTPLPTPRTPASPMVDDQHEEGLIPQRVLPLLPAPDPLSVLRPFGFWAVERGMQRFLQQLDRMGQCLGDSHGETGLWPWLVAGAAAVTACEIARRQLRRASTMPEGDAGRGLAAPPDYLWGGRS
jgi:hypothetical protein